MHDFTQMTSGQMRALPDYNTQYYVLLGEWRADVAALAKLKADEMAKRLLLTTLTFPSPVEGTQHHVFGNAKTAAKLTLGHVISRTVDPAAIGACIAALRETIGAGADAVVKYKPELAIKEYKALTAEQQAVLAPAITSKPGSPQLKFVEAKE
jgi:hypothetical protein